MPNAAADADVVIVGGGLVGSTLAAAIASHPQADGLRITLVDPQPPAHLDEWPAPSLRTTTVSPSSRAFLRDAGVWNYVPLHRAAPFADMLVWDHPGGLADAAAPAPGFAPAGALHFAPADVGEQAMGHVVDNDALRTAAFHRLAALAADQSRVALTVLRDSVRTIDFGNAAEASDARHEDNAMPRSVHDHNHAHDHDDDFNAAGADVPWPAVRLASGGTVRARLLVAADGARSRVRTLAGAQWFAKPYGEAAVVANVTVDAPFHTALQRFLPTGPVAMLPMCDLEKDTPGANVIWSTTPAEAGALLRADDAAFVDELNAALSGHEDEGDVDSDGAPRGAAWPPPADDAGLWDLLARGAARAGLDAGGPSDVRIPSAGRVVGKRGSFPLWLGHAPRYVLPERRVALVGDAAHSVHPLAGRGVNLGFADAERLADCVARAAAAGRDVGGEDGAPLRKFEAARLVGNVASLAALHGVHAAFAVPGARGLRRTGMAMLNAMPAAKRLLVRAMR